MNKRNQKHIVIIIYDDVFFVQYTIVSFYFIVSDNLTLSEIILIFRERFRQF